MRQKCGPGLYNVFLIPPLIYIPLNHLKARETKPVALQGTVTALGLALCPGEGGGRHFSWAGGDSGLINSWASGGSHPAPHSGAQESVTY